MRRKLLLPLALCVVVTAIGVVGNAIAGNTPALGLDLQGGISVTKVPVGDFNTESLELTRDRTDERVNSYGIAETEVLIQGDAIIVNLPGVRDQQEAIDITNVSGQVYIRPVLQCFAPPPDETSGDGDTSTTTTTTGSSTTSSTATTVADSAPTTDLPGGAGEARPAGAPDETSTTPPADGSTSSTSSTTADTGSSTTTTPADPAATTTTVATDADGAPIVVSDPTTSQLLPTKDGGQCFVGPASIDPITGAPASTGEVFKDDAEARVLQGTGWAVVVGLTGAGQSVWNNLAAQCYSGGESCPSRQLAIEIDGVIQTAPVVQEPRFNDSVSITGMDSGGEARTIARVLRSGALPVRLENADVRAVSATLGKDSLDAAIISGAVGIALVLLFMFLYYRWLAVVAVGGLAIAGGLLWTVVCLMSAMGNLALTLSGAAGIIVSIGVTVDSYVVFFERLKDEVRAGRSLRNSATRGFHAAWRTILAANMVSLIGALVLWYLSVGSVRGFALFLGISTILDIIVAWAFTRPAVLLIARSSWLEGRKVMGLEVAPTTPGRRRPVTPGGATS